jgi:hypothetical protein
MLLLILAGWINRRQQNANSQSGFWKGLERTNILAKRASSNTAKPWRKAK